MPQDEFYEDWRHRDCLTWQIPSVVVVVGGVFLAAAFATDIEEVAQGFLLGFGIALSSFMTTMLAQNLYYQDLDMLWLSNPHVPRRPIPPHISPHEGFSKRLRHVFSLKRWGSTLLLILCFGVAGGLTYLFITTLFVSYWERWLIILLPLIPFIGFSCWLRLANS